MGHDLSHSLPFEATDSVKDLHILQGEMVFIEGQFGAELGEERFKLSSISIELVRV